MTWQRATALLPLALLSAGWTASLALPTSATAAADAGRLPDGTTIPGDPIEAPASVTRPGAVAPGVPDGAAASVVAAASAHGIPDAALSAYQRAAQVIDTADPGCNVDWTLIAAIGRVESDHGRYGNNILGDDGVSRPGIYGIPLDGSNGTARIEDTDAGELDDDGDFDLAVGPMQFIPSTWSVVGVDGDGDGVRNPQDVDDAALATAVYLCSGEEDLSTDAGRRAAVYRYNRSERYVELVLAIMRAYAGGNFAAVPNGSAAPVTFTRDGDDQGSGRPGRPDRDGGSTGGGTGGKGDGDGGSTGGTAAPTPTGDGSGDRGSGGSGGGGTDGPGGGGGNPTPTPNATPAIPDPPPTVTGPWAEATAWCRQNLTSAQLDLVGGLDACATAYLDGGATAVHDLLDQALGGPPLPSLPEDPLG